jgi:hypothetical protein
MPEATPRLGLKKPYLGEELWGQPLRETIDTLDEVAETVEGAQAKVTAHALTAHGMSEAAHDVHDHTGIIGVGGSGVSTLDIPEGVVPPADPDTGDLWLDTGTDADQFALFRLPLFNHFGSLATTTSGRWYPPTYIRVMRLLASLESPGAGDTVVNLLKNGALAASVTIPAGQNKAAAAVSVIYLGPETDYMQMQIETAGTGAAGLVLQPMMG